MDRRNFLRSAAAGAVAARYATGAQLAAGGAQPKNRRKVLFVVVDGLDPLYLAASDIPNIKRMMENGVYVEGRSVIPSVTNVNNSSIATASFPEEHGITANYYYDPVKGEGTYMESADFLLRPTLFEKASELGIRSALVTSKEKLRKLLYRGADLAISAEFPPSDLVDKIGPKQDKYSPDINYWSARAAAYLLKDLDFDLVYLATTDYMMHTYPPEDERSRAHIYQFDKLLGQIVDTHPNIEVYLTADHGMSAKTHAIDLGKVLASQGIDIHAVPIIKDRYVAHHKNLGGANYIYLKRKEDFERVFAVLKGIEGVDEVFSRAEAVKQFRLHPDRIGDLFVLGKKDVVFGNLDKDREDVNIRSHGSRHESTVPILCYGRKVEADQYKYNLDLTRHFEWDWTPAA